MTTPSRHHRARRAFTLLEVIIAVTIVALLAALVVPRLTRFLAGAHEDKAVAEVNTLANQVRLYITTETTGTLNNDFTLETLLDGDDPYLENANQLIDPWGNEYELRIPGEINRDFDVVSLGADQEPSDDDIVHGSSR
jgi:general secretion pathway protein G